MYNGFLSSNILYLSIRNIFNREFNKNRIIFNRGLIPAHYNCICTLVLTTLKMATLAAETRRWSLCNKITFIHSSAFFGVSKNFMHPVDVTIFFIWLYG